MNKSGWQNVGGDTQSSVKIIKTNDRLFSTSVQAKIG